MAGTISRWPARHDIEREPPYQDEDWLFKQYVTRSRSVSDIAEHCAVEGSTISYWIGRHGISKTDSFDRTNCATCGESFRYYPSVREGTYCSNECAHEPTKRQVTVRCPNCGVEFERRASLDTYYCSPACWGKISASGVTDSIPAGSSDSEPVHSNGMDTNALSVEFQKKITRNRPVVAPMSITKSPSDCSHSGERLFAQWGKPGSDTHALRNLVTVCRRHHPDSPGG